MASFQKIVLITAIIILIIVLIFIGITLAFTKPEVWPPVVPQCPDYWTMDGSGNNTVCNNVQNLGTCGVKSMNFNQPQFSGSQGTCNKYTWSQNCDISWDGITYGLLNNPCSTQTSSSST